jgi:hypothetical protein
MKSCSETSYGSAQLRAHADGLQEMLDSLRRPPATWANNIRMTIWALRTGARVVEVVERALRSGADESGLVIHPTALENMRTRAINEFVAGMEDELSR